MTDITTTYPFLNAISGYGQQQALNQLTLSSRITTNLNSIGVLNGK